MKNLKSEVKIEVDGVEYVGMVELKPVTQKTKIDYKVYGVKINRHNDDPEKSVEYMDDCVGFTPERWESKHPFNAIKPCIIKGNKVVGYLNPNCYYEFIDGTKAPITDPNSGNVMVEIPKTFYRISQDDNYTYIEITDSDSSLSDGFTDWAFSYNGKVHDKFYVGAYKGILHDGKLSSVSDKKPRGNKTIGEFRAAAQKNGQGYEMMTFNKLTLLQILYIIKFKNLNSQQAIGDGLTNADDTALTGGTDNKGLYYGDNDKKQVKCHGIEDFWGNIFEWVDGLVSIDGEIKVTDGNFNDTGDGYDSVAKISKNIWGLMTGIHGSNKTGFVPAECDQDYNGFDTFYSNYACVDYASAARMPSFGGYRGYGASAGAFFLSVNGSASSAVAFIGARLTCVLNSKGGK